MCFLFTFLQANAQDWQNKITNDSDFFDIRSAFDQYYVSPDDNQDGEDKQFKRWAHIMGQRVHYNNGRPIAPDIIYTEWKKYFANHPMPSARGKKNSWTYAGPTSTPTRGGGNGRINCFKFHPGNTEIMWAGTPAGGLWKSINGGKSWETKTDYLPNLGVTDIAINPRYPDSMFIATGDGFGYSIGNGNFWGGTYSMGVLLSTDGGESWLETGLNWQRNQTRQIYKLTMHPKDPDRLYATTNTGIWKSDNAGKDWVSLKSGSGFRDLIFHPSKPGLILATTTTSMWYSQDTGWTWKSVVMSFSKTPRAISLAVAPGADSIVYALINYSPNTGGLFRSDNYGVTWKEQPGTIGTTFQGWYDLAIGVSPKNPDRVVIGGLDMMMTDDAGKNWRTISNWYSWQMSYYVHADHRAIVFYPNSNDTFLSINDGGVFKSVNGGKAWSNISSNIQALQFYKLGSMPSEEGIIFAGAQDNGINRGKFGAWSQVMGADGMEVVASHQDPNIVYASSQFGNLAKSFNGGSSFDKYIYPTQSSWVTPVEMDDYDADILYFGAKHLYKTVNGGDDWKDLTPGLNVGGEITSIELTSDPKIIYIAHTSANSVSGIRFRRSKDGGATWSLINKTLPIGNNYLSDIGSNPKNPAHVWITISGYNAVNKVFESKDTGTTWTNISDGLPNVPVNCVQGEGSVENGIYIGTDLGVFYRSNSTPGWVFYNDDLPLVMVNELEILPQFNKIRAATYGRGVWEAPLTGTIVSVDKIKRLAKEIYLFPNPAQTEAYLRLPKTGLHLQEIRIYDITGKLVQLVNPASSELQIKLDTKHFPAGVYMVNIFTQEGVFTKKLSVIK
ncbi:MAG: T9SS type A sorting domain-containing protein [Bacteroidia bacterium]